MNHVQFKIVNYKPKVNSTRIVENPVQDALSLIYVSLQRNCRPSSRHLRHTAMDQNFILYHCSSTSLQGHYGRPDTQENSQLSRQEVKSSPLVRTVTLRFYLQLVCSLHVTDLEHGVYTTCVQQVHLSISSTAQRYTQL
jgi:hypothetical protein